MYSTPLWESFWRWKTESREVDAYKLEIQSTDQTLFLSLFFSSLLICWRRRQISGAISNSRISFYLTSSNISLLLNSPITKVLQFTSHFWNLFTSMAFVCCPCLLIGAIRCYPNFHFPIICSSGTGFIDNFDLWFWFQPVLKMGSWLVQRL